MTSKSLDHIENTFAWNFMVGGGGWLRLATLCDKGWHSHLQFINRCGN